MNIVFKSLLLLVSAFLLSACEDESTDENCTEWQTAGYSRQCVAYAEISANGYYDGTFTENGLSYPVFAILHNGTIYAISTQAGTVYQGVYSTNENELNGSVSAYYLNGGLYADADLSGTFKENESIDLSFQTDIGTAGTVKMNFNSAYNATANLETIGGNWIYSEGSYSVSITVESGGQFFGQDTNGCAYSGVISQANGDNNIFDVTLSIEACNDLNGDYDGLGATFNNGLEFDVIATNTNSFYFYPFSKQ